MLDGLRVDPRLRKLDKSGQELVLALGEHMQKQSQNVRLSALDRLRKSVELQKAASAGDVHVSQELANVLIAYFQNPAHMVASQDGVMPVKNQAGKFHKMLLGDTMRQHEAGSRRAAGAEAPVIEHDRSQTTYSCVRRAIAEDVPDEVAANQVVGSAEIEAAEVVAHAILMIKEKVFLDAIFKTGVFTDRTGVSGTPSGTQFKQFDDAASVPRDIFTGEAVAIHERTGFAPNRLVLSPHVLKAILLHADVVDGFKYTTSGATPSLSQLAAFLFADALDGMTTPQIRVAGGVHNTAVKGAADAMSFMASKGALLGYVDENPGLYRPTAYLNFHWVAEELGGAGSSGIITKRFSFPERAIKLRVEAEMFTDHVAVESQLATFFATAVG